MVKALHFWRGIRHTSLTFLFQASNVIVQYVVVRGDLLTKFHWPLGALMAQVCHAATAAIHLNYEDDHTREYLKDLDNMHKVILEVGL